MSVLLLRGSLASSSLSLSAVASGSGVVIFVEVEVELAGVVVSTVSSGVMVVKVMVWCKKSCRWEVFTLLHDTSFS